MAAWLEEIVGEDRLLLPGHSACAGCGPAINIRHVLGGLASASAGLADGSGDPGLVLDDHRGCLAGQCVQGRRSPDSLRLGGGGSIGDQGGPAASRPRRHERGRLGRRRRHLRHRILGCLRRRRAKRGHHLRPQRQRGVHEHRRAEIRRHAGGRLDDDDAGELSESRTEEGHRPDHGGPRDPVRCDARARIRPDAAGLPGEGGQGRRGPGLPVPADPGRMSARLEVSDGPVDGDISPGRRVTLLPSRRLRRRRVEDHVPSEERRCRCASS